MPTYLEKLAEAPLVLDGAMGTVIYDRGVFVNACYDELSLTRPDLIRGIHADYLEAGADVLLTNTFGANRIKLSPFGLGEDAAAICRAAVTLAREAAAGKALVAGDAGPCLPHGSALTDASLPEVRQAFEEQIGALAEAGADFIFLETFADLRELQLAASVARQCGLPVHASFTVNDMGESAVGQSAAAIVDALEADTNVDTVGLNCSIGPSGLFDLVEQLLSRTSKPVMVKPNAGMPREVSGRMLYLTSPEYFTEYAKRFITLGVRGFGGCCGTTPEHIREAARAIKAVSRALRRPAVQVVSAPQMEEAEQVSVPMARKSRFAAKLSRGERVTSIEVMPPKSPDLSSLFDKVRECHFAGIDAINIPDGPRASARVSPLVTAYLIKEHIGIEPVPHYCCRDRNLLGMQSDLLGAAALGISNLLVVTGDTPKAGDQADITGVFDLDSVGLTQLISNLNRGYDFGGNRISPPSAFLVGVGANPFALDIDREIAHYVRKLEAGAEYAITQPVFDADTLLRFLDRLSDTPRQIPILAGIWPLASFKNAEFMRNEVPGVVVPDSVMERLSRCATKEDARKVGIEIAREIAERIGSSVAGIQVSAPLGNVGTALRVLE